MQFGSIGWSVGATLGYAQALKGKKRVIASIGDGSFQVTAQVHPSPCISTQSVANLLLSVTKPHLHHDLSKIKGLKDQWP